MQTIKVMMNPLSTKTCDLILGGGINGKDLRRVITALLSKSLEETISSPNAQHRGAGQVVCYLRGIPSLLGKHAFLPQATRPAARHGRRLLGGPPGASGDPTAWQPQAHEHCAGGQKTVHICLRVADVDNAT